MSGLFIFVGFDPTLFLACTQALFYQVLFVPLQNIGEHVSEASAEHEKEK